MAESSPGLHCDTCMDEKKTVEAKALCTQCKQMYCKDCLKFHKGFTATKDHLAIHFEGHRIRSNERNPECDVCLECDQTHNPSTAFCKDCWQFYCDSCKRQHEKMRATRQHELHQIPGSKQKSLVPDVSVHKSSDFEDFTENTGRRAKQLSKHISEDSVSLSSDFEELSLPTAKEFAGAQKPVSHVRSPGNHFDRQAIDKISAKIVGTFNAKTVSDKKECLLHGIIRLNDGKIVLRDNHNDNIKLFDSGFNLICTSNTERFCYGITKVSEREIAVVGNKIVYFYSIINEMFVRQEKVFRFDGQGYNISYNGNIYVITCDLLSDHPYIQILSESGEKLHRIESFSIPPGAIINLDSHDDSIYINPLYTSGTLSCITSEGQLKWKSLFYGNDVVELHNCLLVTSFTDHAVYVVTKDGSYSRIIIQDKDKLQGPEYMAYNPDTQQLYVTHSKQNTVTILQLDFS